MRRHDIQSNDTQPYDTVHNLKKIQDETYAECYSAASMVIVITQIVTLTSVVVVIGVAPIMQIKSS